VTDTAYRILVVDDNPTNRRILVLSLQKAGYELLEAVDGRQGVDLALAAHPDIVLMDVNMPVLDGFQACAELKADTRTADIPVIFITAKTGAEDIEMGFSVGGADYVTKPFFIREVKARVSIHLQLSRAVKDLAQSHMQLLQAQKLESIGQLAAGIAHEINTPAQYVGDNLRFLEESLAELWPLLTTSRELAAAVSAGSASASDLARGLAEGHAAADTDYLCEEIPRALEQSIDGMGRVSKIVRAMKEYSHPGVKELTNIDLASAIESTITVSANEWKYVAEIETEFDAALPTVQCHPGELNQVFLNMIVNAAHAIADVEGGKDGEKGVIRISTRRDGDMAEIRIADSGTGIPESARERIFDPFFTTKGVGKGTGQGLSIAYVVVVDNHGGTLSFETELGVGTTFIIRIPIAQKIPCQEKAA
jgi:signal transduction histidine kinase